jgi:hypothetical protein
MQPITLPVKEAETPPNGLPGNEPSDSTDFDAPLVSRAEILKRLQELYPGLTEEEFTLMGG